VCSNQASEKVRGHNKEKCTVFFIEQSRGSDGFRKTHHGQRYGLAVENQKSLVALKKNKPGSANLAIGWQRSDIV